MEMIIDYKASPILGFKPQNEAHLLVYSKKLIADFLRWHNLSCAGMNAGQAEAWRVDNNFMERRSFAHLAFNEAKAIAVLGAHWNPKVPDHASGGVIHYPPGLDLDNSGSKGSFLFGVAGKLGDRGVEDADAIAVADAIYEAEQSMLISEYWDVSYEDVIDA